MRWIGGGTGAGKSTVARALAATHDALVYDGDRAEHGWLDRATADEHPRFHAMVHAGSAGASWARRTAAEIFDAMASRHGETIGFVTEDLLALPGDRPVLVDWFGNPPRDVAPLLLEPWQAVFLLPRPDFRRRMLTDRYADPERARANWGDHDPAAMLAKRLDRDALWDAEVRQQAAAAGLRVVEVDGSRSAGELAADLAGHFRLPAATAVRPGRTRE
ncbi:hypothetical protein SAMN04488563_2786 [Jiangella alkaliphila]|uniref:AAA domain-containing protein n=1 Tax=Jiangella alkaliphila TaxID=419479 RepID=A0A1H2JK28_9ACTN|nr:hypothetical protein SAMN04488563_2786 [Jiangella alkaliphila]